METGLAVTESLRPTRFDSWHSHYSGQALVAGKILNLPPTGFETLARIKRNPAQETRAGRHIVLC